MGNNKFLQENSTKLNVRFDYLVQPFSQIKNKMTSSNTSP